MTNYLEEPTNPGKDDGRCALCKISGLDEVDRCHGCGYLICDDCDSGTLEFGPHLVVAHSDEYIDE